MSTYFLLDPFEFPGVGNNFVRTKKSFKYKHLNFPGKEVNVTDYTEQ